MLIFLSGRRSYICGGIARLCQTHILRLGRDAEARAALRARVAANRATAPLFDTPRFTRNLEQQLRRLVAELPAPAKSEAA